jgi:hypothetical protein
MEMQLTEDVILDLMPLYLGNAASAQTRKLVEQYLVEHPAMAAQAVHKAHEEGRESMRNELTALRRTRSALRQRDFNMAFAIACTAAPFSFWYDGVHGGSKGWLMIRDLPSLGLAFWAAAIGFWVGYAIWQRRTRATGL